MFRQRRNLQPIFAPPPRPHRLPDPPSDNPVMTEFILGGAEFYGAAFDEGSAEEGVAGVAGVDSFEEDYIVFWGRLVLEWAREL